MKANGPDTGGTVAFQIVENAPREGVPFHKHTHEDESFYVLDGQFELTVGDKTVVGGPGTYMFGPRGVPHRWTDVGTGRGQMLITWSPTGFEGMFYEIGVPIANSAGLPPTDPGLIVAKMQTVPQKYGMIRTGDPKFANAH